MIERHVNINLGEQEAWACLLETLQAYDYKIKNELPYQKLVAERGSKLTSALAENTKKGYRELTVTFSSQPDYPDNLGVTFRYEFPYAMTITWSSTRKDCEQLVDDFAMRTQEAPSAPYKSATGNRCPKCNTENPIDAVFCGGCGAKLEQVPTAAAESGKVCPKCQTVNPTDAAFCGGCGAKLEEADTAAAEDGKVCPQCQTMNPGDAGFCSECGARLDTVEPAAEKPPEQPTTCPACGAPLAESAKFCGNCGAKIEAPQKNQKGEIP